MFETVQQLLRSRVHDDSPAVACGEKTWTWREHLTEALAIYRDLDRDLEEAEAKRTLEPGEVAVLQKALFSIGCIKIDLEEYEDAFEYFRALQLRFRERKLHVASLYAANS